MKFTFFVCHFKGHFIKIWCGCRCFRCQFADDLFYSIRLNSQLSSFLLAIMEVHKSWKFRLNKTLDCNSFLLKRDSNWKKVDFRGKSNWMSSRDT